LTNKNKAVKFKTAFTERGVVYKMSSKQRNIMQVL